MPLHRIDHAEGSATRRGPNASQTLSREDRYVAGWSIQQARLQGDDSVRSVRVAPTVGLYADTVERSFDTEWTATRAHDPRPVMAEIATLAAQHDQWDIFVSRVIAPTEVNANARPGVEVRFHSRRDLDAEMPVLQSFTARGQDGFTMVVDPQGGYIGVRLQYVPEISARWDAQARARMLAAGGIEAELQLRMQALNDIARKVRGLPGVARATVTQYDTVVFGRESYDALTDRRAAGGNRQAGGEAWFARPVRAGLERAVARHENARRSGAAGHLPDAGGGLLDARRSAARRPESAGDRGGRAEGRSAAHRQVPAPECAVEEGLTPLPGVPVPRRTPTAGPDALP